MIDIVKAFLKTTSGTIANIVFGSLSIKIIASVLGPQGLGLYSFLRQIHVTALLVSSGGQNALVQGGSSREGDTRVAYLRSILLATVVIGAVASVGLVTLAPVIARSVIGRPDEVVVAMLRLLSISVFVCILATFANGVQNVYRELGQMTIAQFTGALLSLLVSYPVAIVAKRGYEQVLPAILIVLQVGTLTVSLLFLKRGGRLWSLVKGVWSSYDREHLSQFFKFAGVSTITAMFGNLVVLAIRTLIVRRQGLAQVGIFEAAWALSMSYVSLVTGAFGAYYLPTLSGLVQPEKRVAHMRRMLHFSVLAATPFIVIVILLKPIAIQFLFSSEFLPAIKVLRWMLIGDYFKITSFVFAYSMVAFADIRMLFWSEVLSNLVLLAGGLYAVLHKGSIEGIGASFLCLYLIYFVFTLSYVRRKHGFTFSRFLGTAWFGGLSLVILASFQNWTLHPLIDFSMIAIWTCCLVVFATFTLGEDGRRKLSSYLRR